MFQTEHNLDLFEPFLAFRRALLKALGCDEHLVEHLFQSASALRKVVSLFLLTVNTVPTVQLTYFILNLVLFSWTQGLRFSLAAAALYELKELCVHYDEHTVPSIYFLSRVHTSAFLF